MQLTSEQNQFFTLWTDREKLRKAKNNFLRLRKTDLTETAKIKRAVHRDILSTRDELNQKLKGLQYHA